MLLYAESSAVLAWLLGQAQGEAVADVLRTSTARGRGDARSAAPELRLLTLDQRVRENGVRLGFVTVP
jgi:hypothetical protein